MFKFANCLFTRGYAETWWNMYMDRVDLTWWSWGNQDTWSHLDSWIYTLLFIYIYTYKIYCVYNYNYNTYIYIDIYIYKKYILSLYIYIYNHIYIIWIVDLTFWNMVDPQSSLLFSPGAVDHRWRSYSWWSNGSPGRRIRWIRWMLGKKRVRPVDLATKMLDLD
jgi:hypothetical protein